MTTETEYQAGTARRLIAALPHVTAFGTALLRENEGRDWSPVQRTALGLTDRATCWLATLERLTNTSHFQAHLAALRAMIEIVVDLGLLHIDPSQNEQLEAWELSARHRHAKAVADYKPIATQPRAARAKAFADENSARVDALRLRFGWLDRDREPRHPMRWTNRQLGQDVGKVHEQLPSLGLEAVFFEFYSYLCLQVHGSGLAGVRGAISTDMLAPINIALIGNARLAFGCYELTLRALDTFDFERQGALLAARDRWASVATTSR